MAGETKLVWLPAHLAEQVEAAQGDAALEAVIEKHFSTSMDEIKTQLEALDDHVIQYRGLMAKARTQFTEAATAEVEKAYEVWEAMDGQMPSIQKKTQKIVDELAPLKTALEEVNRELNRINLHQLERAVALLQQIGQMPESTRQMLTFLMDNYRGEE